MMSLSQLLFANPIEASPFNNSITHNDSSKYSLKITNFNFYLNVKNCGRNVFNRLAEKVIIMLCKLFSQRREILI